MDTLNPTDEQIWEQIHNGNNMIMLCGYENNIIGYDVQNKRYSLCYVYSYDDGDYDLTPIYFINDTDKDHILQTANREQGFYKVASIETDCIFIAYRRCLKINHNIDLQNFYNCIKLICENNGTHPIIDEWLFKGTLK